MDLVLQRESDCIILLMPAYKISKLELVERQPVYALVGPERAALASSVFDDDGSNC